MATKQPIYRLSTHILAITLVLSFLIGCGSQRTLGSGSAQTDQSALSKQDIATLKSLRKIDNHPLYTMHYRGSYRNRAALAENALEVTSQLPSTPWACSLFAALGDTDSMVFGRNFDWQQLGAVFLFTDPPDGYASVSIVAIPPLGLKSDRVGNISELSPSARQALLRAPFELQDGMNENGLVVTMAAVPSYDMVPDPSKKTIGSLAIMREILDYAGDIDDAIAIIKQYNINMTPSLGPPIHYLIADRSGRAVLVEFYQRKMVLIPNGEPWHLATNFLVAPVSNSPKGQCPRYDKMNARLIETKGRLTMQDAADLLARVANKMTQLPAFSFPIGTQWSAVYGMNTGDVQIKMGSSTKSHTLHLNMMKKQSP